jgi:16S rRNA (guanine527-N7)-methyltransferase
MSTTPTLEELVAEEAPRQKLAQYLDMLQKWNKIYNLTAITDRQEMLSKQIAESLAAGEWLHGDRILDIGTGAGLPGIPLAITHPDKTFCLLDSNGKKVRFLKQAIQQ